jgi:hypothetical protein
MQLDASPCACAGVSYSVLRKAAPVVYLPVEDGRLALSPSALGRRHSALGVLRRFAAGAWWSALSSPRPLGSQPFCAWPLVLARSAIPAFSGFSGTWPPQSTAARLGVGSVVGVWSTGARLLRHLPTSRPRLSLSLALSGTSISSPMHVFSLLVFVDRWSTTASSCSAVFGLVAALNHLPWYSRPRAWRSPPLIRSGAQLPLALGAQLNCFGSAQFFWPLWHVLGAAPLL